MKLQCTRCLKHLSTDNFRALTGRAGRVRGKHYEKECKVCQVTNFALLEVVELNDKLNALWR
jgi:hypothetical protein